MARTDSAVLPHEETAPAQEEFLHPEMDGRFTNLDEEDSTPFLRKQRRVPVRRGPLPKKTTKLLKWVALALCAFTVLGVAYAFIYRYGERSWRFRVDSSDQIEIAGTQNASRAQVMDVFGSDIGRNIFFVPLDERREQLEQIPWVESAEVMRFVPNRLKVSVQERIPVAFVRIGSRIGLIDDTGHIMELPAHGKTQYSFPVIAGTRDTEPLSTRAARMKVYNELVRELDSEGGHYSSELSEVDLSDPDDTKAIISDPSGDVLLHLGSVGSGSGNYLDRVKLYHAHAAEWRQQFEKLESVDLRYERQVVVNPDLHPKGDLPVHPPVALTPKAAKAVLIASLPPVAVAAARLEKTAQAAAKPPLVPAKMTTKLPAKSTAKPTAKPTAVKPVAAPDPRGTGASPVHRSAAPAPKAPQSSVQPTKLPAKPLAQTHAPKPSVHLHQAAKKSAKPSPHKRGKARHSSRKRSPHRSAAKAVKPASAKSHAFAPPKPHQLSGVTKTSSNGKPHAAIVNQ